MRRALLAAGAVGGVLALAGLALASGAVGSPAAGGAPEPIALKCGSADDPGTKPFWLRASDGVKLYAIEAGSGSVGVVLAHESPADLCGWLPYAATLTHSGLRVLAFDFRGFGDSDRPAGDRNFIAYDRDFKAAVARLHDDGARKVFLIGASFGGAAALTYGPELDLAGLISLSGETHISGAGLDGLAAIPKLKAPLLIVGSRHDRYLSVPDAVRLLHRARSHDKRTALYPGGFHGWDIVEDAPYAAKARTLILNWIRARS